MVWSGKRACSVGQSVNSTAIESRFKEGLIGESQCPTCHHIVTGFERDDFEAGLAVLAAKDAEIERLRAKITKADYLLTQGAPTLALEALQ